MANELTGLMNRVNKAIRNDKNLRTALSTTLAIHKPRIFQQGQDAKGAQIGTYGTSPISISKSSQARQTGQTYFPGGYGEYKRIIGKNPGYVILRNTDQMFFDYGLQGSSLDYGFGFQNQVNADKSGWMETKYNKEIFQLSDKEVDTLGTVLNAQISNEI